MKPYIDVIGESKYLETVQKYVVHINIIVWTNRTKIALNELIDLRNRCIETLKSNGLQQSELKEGGVDIRRNWLNRRKFRQEVFQKIIISCSDLSPLLKALSNLEPLFKNRRYSFTLDIIEPVFNQSLGVEKKARKEAIENACSSATYLAEAANLNIDKIIEIEELSPIIGEFEVYNDDWKKLTVSSKNNLNFRSLENASRQITLRYRVSFATKPLSDQII